MSVTVYEFTHGEPLRNYRYVDASDYAALEAKYHELIMAVGNAYPDETRHQTALRYIQQAEVSGLGCKADHAASKESP
jgi:hypothetical protein